MKIRRASARDYEAVAQLLLQSYEEHMKGFEWYPNYRAYLSDTAARASFGTVLIAEESDAIVGTVTIHTTHDRHGEVRPVGGPAALALLAVSSDARSHGVGQALMEAALSNAQATGFTAAELHTMPSMVAAQRLYQRMQFVRAAEHDVLDDEGNVELMVYEIQLSVRNDIP